MSDTNQTDDSLLPGDVRSLAPDETGEGAQGLLSDAWIQALRDDILNHLTTIALPAKTANGTTHVGVSTKAAVRASHSHQRQALLQRNLAAIGRRLPRLLGSFADGSEVNPAAIDPELILVKSDRETGYLFRLATLLWSVPVSAGYGRRMRYLVRDRSNGKLIGVFALGDPVFNLSARDSWVGWSVNDRRARLVNVMDAYVVGAVPPYSQLLGGKLVASMIASREVSETFSARYNQTRGIISGQLKAARLALVTVTSALGRSSLYNRLKLVVPGQDSSTPAELVRIGETRGYGHFQLSESTFERLRQLLAAEGHPYASGHQYGHGPNWRLRVIRVGLRRLGLDGEILRHGILREIYAMPLAPDFRDFLCGRVETPCLNRPPAAEIAAAAVRRWVIPRAVRTPQFAEFRREQILDLVGVTDAPFLAHVR
jgi:hypothetical protein